MALATAALAAAQEGASLFNAGQQQNNSLINQEHAEAYNTSMADTVYQRGVEDLKAAGLNPILAAGSPDPMASVGAMPGAQPQTPNIASDFSAVNQAPLQAAQTQSAIAGAASATAKAKLDLDNAQLTEQKLPEAILSADMARDHPELVKWGDFLTGHGLGLSTAINAATGGLSGFLGGVLSNGSSANEVDGIAGKVSGSGKYLTYPTVSRGTPNPFTEGYQ